MMTNSTFSRSLYAFYIYSLSLLENKAKSIDDSSYTTDMFASDAV